MKSASKFLLTIILILLACSSAVHADFKVPEGIETNSNVHFKPYITPQEDCIEFYIEGFNLHYRMRPDKYTKKLSITIGYNADSIETVSATEENVEVIGVMDLSWLPNSTVTSYHTITVEKYNKNNTGYQLLHTNIIKTYNTLSFENTSGNLANKNYAAFYNNLPQETIEYYKSDYIGDENDEYGKVYREKASQITAGLSTDYEKAFAIYEWVSDNVYYDMDAYNGVGEDDGQSALVALNEGRAVCGGYASLTAMLLQGAGIPARFVFGTANLGEYHAWNYVYIDGKWSFLDTTWASGNKYEGGVFTKGDINYAHFGMTTQLLGVSRRCKQESGSVLVDDILYKFLTYNGEECYKVVDCLNKIPRDIKILDKVNGKNVRIIDSKAFDSNDVKSVQIPETVLRINQNGFYNMTGFKLYFMGKDTQPYNNSFIKCSDYVIYAHTDSYIMTKSNTSNWNAKAIKNLNWYIDSVEYPSYLKIRVNVKHGVLKEQPVLVVGLYDNYDRLVEVRKAPTSSDTESYLFDFKGYNNHYYTRSFLLSDTESIEPYSKSARKRLAIEKVSDITYESYHCYGNNYDESFTYKNTVSNCKNIDITFNRSTYTEPDKDFIIIYDAEGNEFGRYSGFDLSSRTLCVPGKGFTIRLVSNEKNGNFYGYRITSITENYN